jgi:hypothetical protein
MKAALTPPALQYSAEIDIGPFTGRAPNGNVILVARGIRYGITISWGTCTPSLCAQRNYAKFGRPRRSVERLIFQGFHATRHPPPMPSCVLCIGVGCGPSSEAVGHSIRVRRCAPGGGGGEVAGGISPVVGLLGS